MKDPQGRLPERNLDADAQVFRDAGVEPPWERVYSNGVDVTDQPELWPDLWAHPEKFRRNRKR
jgi:hypothetical protein